MRDVLRETKHLSKIDKVFLAVLWFFFGIPLVIASRTKDCDLSTLVILAIGWPVLWIGSAGALVWHLFK